MCEKDEVGFESLVKVLNDKLQYTTNDAKCLAAILTKLKSKEQPEDDYDSDYSTDSIVLSKRSK